MTALIHIVVCLTEITEVLSLSILMAAVLLPLVVPFAELVDIRTFVLSSLSQSDAAELVREFLDVVRSKKR